ncbi:hypothetical protein [Novipirellula caenicola]|uniref:Uncharacterized protein n=1 Tax=Novipirellula caenicola TaxID=1536901 RepID=A0ABP9W1C5_9BACT
MCAVRGNTVSVGQFATIFPIAAGGTAEAPLNEGAGAMLDTFVVLNAFA